MDPFAQRMLEKAQERSRNFGITDATRCPLTENIGAGDAAAAVAAFEQSQMKKTASVTSFHNTASSSSSPANRLQVVERTPNDQRSSPSVSPRKVMRHFSAVDKENMDLGIEINIMTDKNIEVEVQVEEQEINEKENKALLPNTPPTNDVINLPVARIRDTSRNRLQRLGCLYSNTDDLSSPIHRTEGNFHAGATDDAGQRVSPKKPKQRFDKLVALANTINQWEDDTVHTANAPVANVVPPPKPDLPSRKLMNKKQEAPPPPASSAASTSATVASKTKQLNWDPKVIDSLEAQGFQRRDSSTMKLAYDYAKKETENRDRVNPSATSTNVSKFGKSVEEKKSSSDVDKKIPAVKPGLVSGRAAAFEHKAAVNRQQQAAPQKDPTELSLKERMKLFERNKGEALIPKAPFGMAPPISKLRQDNNIKKDDTKASTSANPTSLGALLKSGSDCKLRDKVSALVANATLSETKIREEIQKQRQEDMQVLANRFNKQKDLFAKENRESQQEAKDMHVEPAKPIINRPTHKVTGMPPPPPPPPPATAIVKPEKNLSSKSPQTVKRRSPGDSIDDETKRPKTVQNEQLVVLRRLYPALSDLDSNESYSDNDNMCTTATVSGRSTAEELRSRQDAMIRDCDDQNDSYMESDADDSSVGICDGSLGREIMQVVQKNEHHHHSQQRHQQNHNHHHQQQQQQQYHLQQQLRQTKGVHYADKNSYYEDNGAGDSSMNSSEEESLGVEDYLDEALDEPTDNDCTQESGDDDNDHNNSRLSIGSKGTTASNSFSFRKPSGKYAGADAIAEEEVTESPARTPSSSTPGSNKKSNSVHFSQPVKSELSVNNEDDNMVTLVHTVSFYRRQQNSNSCNTTPVRKICREQQVHRSAMDGLSSANLHFEAQASPRSENGTDSYLDADDGHTTDSDTDDSDLVQEKIKKLLDEVCKQQQVIGQTSQALNLCAATIEFSGSMESVEGERHLLVATHRRQACLDEVQRLRVEKSLRPLGAPKEKGRLTVKEITIPLRQDYIRKLAADTISGHHLVCLIKYNEHVLATRTVPTLPGLLAVKFPDVLQLNNVYADFRITLEIYGMTAQREVLPHEVKYHINLSKKSGIKTPKKKGADNRLIMPPVQSPGGPHVVRTPALVQYGFAIFSLREIQRTTWTLTKVLGVCPLEGIVHMKVNCELSVSVEYKGFLTMFEDISGFGAWHRRWCHLNGTMLNYWKYPDDEKKKTPMGSIDLYTCVSQKVTLAPRDICARLNTMLLECQRPAKETDQQSLIIVPNGRTTIVRHLLSADTKEEREEWCAYFNKALTLLRAWGPPQ